MAIMRRLISALIPLLLATVAGAVDWPAINPEDLSMTSIKEQPGAPAVILLREEVDDDMNSFHSVYQRIKILTDAGREYANVELPYSRRNFKIGGISGRTIHADGTIIPFEGKPFDKTVIKGGGLRINVKSFSLPDVQVGSIIDFKYSQTYDDHSVVSPSWEVQTDLFQRKATFKFIPFQNQGSVQIMLDHGQISNGVAWTPFLGDGSQPESHTMPARAFASRHDVPGFWVDLTRENIPAFIHEPFMPPESVLKLRVYFYYQQNLKADDYWKAEGKYWSKDVESFIDHKNGEADALAKIVTPADTPEQKVRKIYTFVSSLENQDYIPERTSQEQKVLELKLNKGADDVLQNRSGSHDELNRLFVSLLRVAGIPASLVWVPDRSQEVFLKQYLSTRQFDAEIVVVQIDGKDVYLDPGTKFCPYGVVDWRYTAVNGLRQNTGKGAEIVETPYTDYTQAVETRRADVVMDEHGMVTGTTVLVFKGLQAMQLRQRAGKTDANGRKKLLEEELRRILPGNSEILLTNAPEWDVTEKPLVAQFHVSCPFAVAAGKRLMLPQHLFQMNEKAQFPSATRHNAVYFNYPWQEADEVLIKLPSGMTVESLAPNDTLKLDYAIYRVTQKQDAPDKIYSRRDFAMASGLVMPEKYKEVKEFFDKLKADDDQPALVRATSSVANN